MTDIKQRDELQSTIWKIANEVRGAVDGWDFKQFVLGTLFYRFICENFTNFIEGGDESVNYANMSDNVITPDIKDDATKTKGYFIYPSQLFVNIAKNANSNPNLNTDLAAIFDAIESSANGYPSEHDINGLFADFDTTSNRLGNTVEEKNKRLAAVIKGVGSLDFGNFEDNEKERLQYIATSVDNSKIAENDYNLSVSSYVEAKDTREVIDIVKLNAEVERTVKRIDTL